MTAAGPVETVRLFTRDLDRARAYLAGTLGLAEISTGAGLSVFEAAPAALRIELAEDEACPGPECLAPDLTGFSFGVDDLARAHDALERVGAVWLDEVREGEGRPHATLKGPGGERVKVVQAA